VGGGTAQGAWEGKTLLVFLPSTVRCSKDDETSDRGGTTREKLKGPGQVTVPLKDYRERGLNLLRTAQRTRSRSTTAVLAGEEGGKQASSTNPLMREKSPAAGVNVTGSND